MTLLEIKAYSKGIYKKHSSNNFGLGSMLGNYIPSSNVNSEVKEESTQEDVEAFFGGF